uniref:Uncharacterized protein n=1 Tax=Timema poppense TaxID=170557 RepID=A0A7R9H7I6_TIMPO|nr:unnamed protein product [Timema poppensis]
MFCKIGSMDGDIDIRMNASRRLVGCMWTIAKNEVVSKEAEKAVYKSGLTQTLLYGCEVRVCQEKHKGKVNAFGISYIHSFLPTLDAALRDKSPIPVLGMFEGVPLATGLLLTRKSPVIQEFAPLFPPCNGQIVNSPLRFSIIGDIIEWVPFLPFEFNIPDFFGSVFGWLPFFNRHSTDLDPRISYLIPIAHQPGLLLQTGIMKAWMQQKGIVLSDMRQTDSQNTAIPQESIVPSDMQHTDSQNTAMHREGIRRAEMHRLGHGQPNKYYQNPHHIVGLGTHKTAIVQAGQYQLFIPYIYMHEEERHTSTRNNEGGN